eukprot:3904342-Rhodomonas_salina.2
MQIPVRSPGKYCTTVVLMRVLISARGTARSPYSNLHPDFIITGPSFGWKGIGECEGRGRETHGLVATGLGCCVVLVCVLSV